jgi:hypothetical protein
VSVLSKTEKLILIQFGGLLRGGDRDHLAGDEHRKRLLLAQDAGGDPCADEVHGSGFRLTELFDHMRQGLAIEVEDLEPSALEVKARISRQYLRPPWGFAPEETPRNWSQLVVDPPARNRLKARDENLLLRGAGARPARSAESRTARRHRANPQQYL